MLNIEIDGTNYDPVDLAACFVLDGGNSVVRGLVINRFWGGPAVYLGTGGNNKVEGSFLGTDVTGTLRRPNVFGVYIGSNRIMEFGWVEPATCCSAT